MRFVRLTSRMQIGAACVCLGLLCAAAFNLMSMAWDQVAVAQERARVDARARTVAAEASKVNAYKQSVGEIAADLDKRQDALDSMVQSQFGSTTAPDVVGKPDAQTQADAASKSAAAPRRKVSMISPALDRLRTIEQRQTQFARRLVALINQRAARAEAAIRSFGLRPEQVAARSAPVGQGGPYIPWRSGEGSDDSALSALASSLSRLNALESGLVAIPSGRPTASPMLSSSYGYRHDPFTGSGAFHAGVDFPGAYGQPILAAAAGRVAYVGQRQGYGNVVEVDHGHGIMTRYAHLSGFGVQPGAVVTPGQPIARMGSTGRSTGTHLHFEVRVNGAPINPGRFLEVRQDVLEVQQIAKQRVGRVATAQAAKSNGRG